MGKLYQGNVFLLYAYGNRINTYFTLTMCVRKLEPSGWCLPVLDAWNDVKTRR
jgi:hypothetical protein